MHLLNIKDLDGIVHRVVDGGGGGLYRKSACVRYFRIRMKDDKHVVPEKYEPAHRSTSAVTCIECLTLD